MKKNIIIKTKLQLPKIQKNNLTKNKNNSSINNSSINNLSTNNDDSCINDNNILNDEINNHLNREKKMQYCCDNIIYLTKRDYIDIGNILKQTGLGYLIIECADGCLIDLDKIKNIDVINQIY